MKGAVAAGHPLTAQTGAEILAEGGNAVDACIAAAFVSWVAESPLTGPGAGGFMLVHRASDHTDRLLDFFVAIPGVSFHGADGHGWRRSTSSSSRACSRSSSSARPRVPCPASVAGLGAAHAAYARMPVGGADRAGGAGSPARASTSTTQQGFLHRILDPILRAEPEGKRIYGGQRAARARRAAAHAGSRGHARPPGRGGAGRLLPRRRSAAAISAAVQERGGSLTRTDLESYRVIRRRPVRVPYRRCEFVSNPPPSAGGLLIAYALSVLDRLGEVGRAGKRHRRSRRSPRSCGRPSSRADQASSAASAAAALPRRLLARTNRRRGRAQRARKRVRRFAPEPAGLPSTTHISVVDARGNAASLSASTGCGSGVIVPGTGIHMNNMLGEEDLNPGGREGSPGSRLTSMMAPSIVLEDGRPRLVVGSAGLDPPARRHPADRRQRTRPRPHRPGGDRGAARSSRGRAALQVEGGIDPDVADQLEAAATTSCAGAGCNLYFGGASAVGLGADGELEAAGDPRRGGAGAVVE